MSNKYNKVQQGVPILFIAKDKPERTLIVSKAFSRTHVNLVFVRYFDDMYVLLPLVVSYEHRLHETTPSLGLREGIVE